MKLILPLSLIGLCLAACAAPPSEGQVPAPPASPETVLGVEDIEPADGVVAGEEEIEVAMPPEDLALPNPPHEMADLPPLNATYFVMKSVDDLRLKGTESPEEIGRHLRKTYIQPGAGEGGYSMELEVFEDGANAMVLFVVEGLADDSVKAEQHVVDVFFPAATPAGVTGYGVRYKCYRAEDPDAWQNTVCS